MPVGASNSLWASHCSRFSDENSLAKRFCVWRLGDGYSLYLLYSPSFSQEEADAVHSVLLSNKVNYWTGRETREFECEFAGYTGCRYAIALANGTLALDLALEALGIGPGDEVVVTPRTFIASISSVVTVGAIPVFADVDENSQNLSAETIAKVITAKTKAIIVVHLAGIPADMDPIMALVEEHSLKVIEDCAQAQGALYKGQPVGSIGHVGAWSFCQDKIMTTGGEGGMVTTNDELLWSAMWSQKDHGKSYDAVYKREHPPGYRWLHESFGTNAYDRTAGSNRKDSDRSNARMAPAAFAQCHSDMGRLQPYRLA